MNNWWRMFKGKLYKTAVVSCSFNNTKFLLVKVDKIVRHNERKEYEREQIAVLANSH